MKQILNITESLSERAGGLANATVNLALNTSINLPVHHITIVSQKDKIEVDSTLSAKPSNLSIKKIDCFRNPVFPYSFGLYNFISDLHPDLIHLRGLWRQPSLTCSHWKQNHPDTVLVVQPAGMLEPWARKRKGFLKQIYYSLLESSLLDSCDAIHATSVSEANNLISMGLPAQKMFVIEEGINMPTDTSVHSVRVKPSGAKKELLFLSRIHPKKGIELLLMALSLIRPQNWTCKIVGMGSIAYENTLKQYVHRLGLDDLVQFHGPVYRKDKDLIFGQADAFILPTYSENFGIAIAEAMSWGLPVITTTGTPWSALSNPSLGWYVEPTINDICFALFELFNKSDSELLLMGSHCKSYVEANFSWHSVGAKMATKYLSLLSN